MIYIKVKLKEECSAISELGREAMMRIFEHQIEVMADEAVFLSGREHRSNRRSIFESIQEISPDESLTIIDYDSEFADAIARHIAGSMRNDQVDIVSVMSSRKLSEICFFLGDSEMHFMEVAIRYAEIPEYMGRQMYSCPIVTCNDRSIIPLKYK